MLDRALRDGKLVLFEGAQGTLLDVDHGTYPFVTSSTTIAGGACAGAGIGPTRIDSVLGITKAYTTRVGGGPFPTEDDGAAGEHLGQVGHEFGATTGRQRRCGWLDVVVLRDAVRVNGITGLALNKLDILTGLPEVQVCVGYRVDGKELREIPASIRTLERCEPIYKTLPRLGRAARRGALARRPAARRRATTCAGSRTRSRSPSSCSASARAATPRSSAPTRSRGRRAVEPNRRPRARAALLAPRRARARPSRRRRGALHRAVPRDGREEAAPRRA